MTIRKLLVALMVGVDALGLTLWSFQHIVVSDPARLLFDLLDLLLMPGLIVSIIAAGGNVHTYTVGPAAMGNLAFYFAVTYIGLVVWERHRRKTGRKLR